MALSNIERQMQELITEARDESIKTTVHEPVENTVRRALDLYHQDEAARKLLNIVFANSAPAGAPYDECLNGKPLKI